MMSFLTHNKYKVFYISPKSIIHCTKESKYCDYTQYSKNRFHPHAGNNRGVFEENNKGLIKIIHSEWDNPGIQFEALLEFKALKNHYIGKQKWRDSDFALRLKEYVKICREQKLFIKSNIFSKLSIYFKSSKSIIKSAKINELLIRREDLIDTLFESIIKNGVQPSNKKNEKKNFIDNISVNLGDDSRILFNNRGHHRLSIAKILNLKFVPVKITVAKSNNILKSFIYKYEKSFKKI